MIACLTVAVAVLSVYNDTKHSTSHALPAGRAQHNLEVSHMDGITAFVDAVYDCYHKLNFNVEEDQELPSKEVMEEVCNVLLNVSCMREEGRFPSFRVCFIRPDAEL